MTEFKRDFAAPNRIKSDGQEKRLKPFSSFGRLRFKVIFGILLILTGILVVLGVFIVNSQRSQLLQNLRTQGEHLALLVARASAEPIRKFSFFRLEELAMEAEQYGEVIFCEIYGTDGDSLVSVNNVISKEHEKKKIRKTGPGILIVEKEIVSNEEVLGKVEIGLRTDLVLDQINRKTIEIIIVFIICLVVAAYAINLFLARLFITPVVRLSDLTRRIARGTFVTTTLDGRNDEIGGLAESFNEMSRNLEQLYSNLEEKVRDRTKDLIKMNFDLETANRKLKNEMEERIRSEMERSELQNKLSHAKKMEAIGTLAGGVAHDLNNILSGLVSYPELMLLKIPEDSSLKSPLLTIKKSGEKAARIVQDLLTLSRRGVTVTEIVNLNDVINDYLRSPEYEKTRTYHPGVTVRCRLESGLMNVLGSPVHLSQTVMNLVVNACEAVSGEGAIQIFTENRYIDQPFPGYDEVAEGDFAVLTVEDNGRGMSEEDMERVFEPFYTKKVMGVSGTGLGMAVVWGAVKDHNGYIDIESQKNRGTTIRIFLPITRKKMPAEANRKRPLAEIAGNSEVIVVVDDIQEQREVAKSILEELGYRVAACESGEAAVAYMSLNKADLLVLDMIMEPGIDGLETYCRILEQHPGQKAVIASGFSKTELVKQAQKLGAGAYIKKPYSIEKLGLAVMEALKKPMDDSFETQLLKSE